MTGPPDEALDPRAWLKRAESSLTCARIGHGVSGVLLEDLCFYAHQAVEKGLKSLLIARSIGFPKTHAIARLLELLDVKGIALPAEVKRSANLTAYAVWTRYPGGPTVTEQDYQEAVKTAEYVVAWINRMLAVGDAPT